MMFSKIKLGHAYKESDKAYNINLQRINRSQQGGEEGRSLRGGRLGGLGEDV